MVQDNILDIKVLMENIIFIIASTLIVSSITIYVTHLIFKKKNLFDNVNARSSHNVTSTRSGGLGIGIAIFIISFTYYIYGIELYEYSLLIPLSLLLVVGLYDDVYQLDFKLKFIFQIIAAKILIDNGLLIDNLHGVFGLFELNRLVAQCLTIFIIVAIINAINFVDGIDGLALSVVILFTFCFEFFINSYNPYTNLSVILISALIPLYYFNFKTNNKIFLGDSGSLFLGGIVSTYVVFSLGNNYIIKPEFDLHKILFVISILFYPIIDIIRVFFLRLINGISPFQPDKNHIHHLVLKKINHHLYTTFIITGISIFFIILIQTIF